MARTLLGGNRCCGEPQKALSERSDMRRPRQICGNRLSDPGCNCLGCFMRAHRSQPSERSGLAEQELSASGIPSTPSLEAGKRAFTLIELLVVLAIIAILAAIMLPALNKAKSAGQSIGCASNLKQLQLAWHMYHHDNNDRLVLNFESGTIGNPQTYHSTSNSWISGSALWDPGSAGIKQGTLWRYTQNERIYRCPSDKSLWSYGATRAPRPWNIVLGIYMNGHWDGVNMFGSAKFTDLRQPDRYFTFVDEEESLVTGGAFVLLLGQQSSWWTVPGFRDRGGGANVAFADGHVQFHKWNYPHRVREGHETPITNTSDREDLRWLLSHVPGAL